MKQKVLIIEDDYKNYLETVERINKEKFDCIPTNQTEFDQMCQKLQSGTIEEYLREIIQSCYGEIRVILCDLKIEGRNAKQGSEIIRFIRNDIEIDNAPLFTRYVPIIAYSNYSNEPCAEEALRNGANVNIQKKENQYFNILVEEYANNFKATFWNANIPSIDRIEKKLDIGMDRNAVLLQEIMAQNEDSFNVLINALFSIMTKEKKEQFYERFKTNIENYISDDEKQKFNQPIWNQIKDAFIAFNSEGGSKQLADTICEILDSAGFLGTRGKIIAAGVKGIAGFISMLKPNGM